MRRLFFIILPLIFGLLTACPTTPERPGVNMRRVEMPEWTRTGRHPDFPQDKFIAGYALAETAAGARQKSETLLEEAACAEALAKGEAVLRGSRVRDLIDSPAQWIDVAELGDAVKFDFAGNGFEYVSVTAISREELRLRAQGMLAGAKKNLATKMPTLDAPELRKRLDAWCARFLLAIRVVALALLATGELERDALAVAEDAAMSLWGLPGVIEATLGGNSQYANIGGGLPKALELKFTYRERAAAAIPLNWNIIAPANGVLDTGNETDAQGMARCNVFSLSALGRETAVIQAAIDLERVAGVRLGISPPVWRWSASLPSRRLGQLLCEVAETIGGEKTDSVLGPALLAWCNEYKLAFTDDAKQPLPETLAYRLKLSGELKVELFRQGTDTVARAQGTLTLSDAVGDTPIYLYTPAVVRTVAAGQESEDCAREALIEASADALAQIAPRIMAALPSIS
ncbi:MAG: hypothetical protein IT462_02775 [Planctomycetes bacterium]|nr:hypothetical protein [Planctomycetota bacterium]